MLFFQLIGSFVIWIFKGFKDRYVNVRLNNPFYSIFIGFFVVVIVIIVIDYIFSVF